MKKNRILMPLMTLIIGILIGATPFIFMSFTQNSSTRAVPQGLATITAPDANVLFKNYFRSATAPTTPIKGFFLDSLQFSAMKLIAGEKNELAGFRVYLGKDRNNLPVSIVVGVDSKGADATTYPIYKTSSLKSGPCPFVCDQTSNITK